MDMHQPTFHYWSNHHEDCGHSSKLNMRSQERPTQESSPKRFLSSRVSYVYLLFARHTSSYVPLPRTLITMRAIYSGIKDRQSTRNKKEKKKREDKNIFVHSGTECNQSCAFPALLCTNNCINEHYVLVLCTKVVKTGKSARKGRYLRLRFPKLAKMSL